MAGQARRAFKLAALLAMAAAAFPLAFLTVFFNVGFLKMVEAHIDGETPTVSYGLRAARSYLPQILGWALLSASVGALLRALEELPIVGGWAGRVVGFVGGVAWSLATFFVVPVLVLEGLGPLASVRRSATVFRRRWGETVTGDIAIGVLAAFLIIPGMIFLALALAEFQGHSYGLGVVFGAIGVALTAPVTALSSALTEMFQYFLYRETVGLPGAGPFPHEELQSGLKPKKRRRFSFG